MTTTADQLQFLLDDYHALRKASVDLAQAAQRVVGTYDGIHRLGLALAAFNQTLADEGKRGDRHGSKAQTAVVDESICPLDLAIPDISLERCTCPGLVYGDAAELHQRSCPARIAHEIARRPGVAAS